MEEKDRATRKKILALSSNYVIACLTGKLRICNIPDGAELLYAYADAPSNSVCVVMCHPSFPVVNPASCPEYILAEVEKVKED